MHRHCQKKKSISDHYVDKVKPYIDGRKFSR